MAILAFIVRWFVRCVTVPFIVVLVIVALIAELIMYGAPAIFNWAWDEQKKQPTPEQPR